MLKPQRMDLPQSLIIHSTKKHSCGFSFSLTFQTAFHLAAQQTGSTSESRQCLAKAKVVIQTYYDMCSQTAKPELQYLIRSALADLGGQDKVGLIGSTGLIFKLRAILLLLLVFLLRVLLRFSSVTLVASLPFSTHCYSDFVSHSFEDFALRER